MSEKGKTSQVQSAQGINGVSRTPYKPTIQYNADGTPKEQKASTPANTNTGTVNTDNGNGSKDGKEGSSSENKENKKIGGTANRDYDSPLDIIRQGSQVIAEQKALREAQKNDPNYRSTTKKITDGISNSFGRFKDMAMGNKNKDKDKE